MELIFENQPHGSEHRTYKQKTEDLKGVLPHTYLVFRSLRRPNLNFVDFTQTMVYKLVKTLIKLGKTYNKIGKIYIFVSLSTHISKVCAMSASCLRIQRHVTFKSSVLAHHQREVHAVHRVHIFKLPLQSLACYSHCGFKSGEKYLLFRIL